MYRRGAVNGWFAGHKHFFLFFESYLDPSNCMYVRNHISTLSFNILFEALIKSLIILYSWQISWII